MLSDSPAGHTGLGRITRELAAHIHEDMPEIDLGVAGMGGIWSRNLPYPLYPFSLRTGWQIEELPQIWDNFAGKERGIIFSIWNVSWAGWLANPKSLPEGDLRNFLLTEPFDKWIYVPIDGHAANGCLHPQDGPILRGFNRVLAYTEYGAEVIKNTLRATTPVEHIPHGIDDAIFHPLDKQECRRFFSLLKDPFIVGAVATNTGRKDWPLAFAVVAELRKRGVDAQLWIHTDMARKHWDMEALADIYGLRGRIIFSNTHMTEENMAKIYGSCDVTLGIGSGEGFGYPIAESLACGVPCITGNYAGATEFTPKEFLMEPTGWKTDGLFCLQRPVFNPSDWAERAVYVADTLRANLLPESLFWRNLWSRWREWLLRGIEK